MKVNLLKNKDYWLATFICLMPILVGIFFYSRLPNEIPVHFDIEFKPDNYASKEFALFAIPIGMAFFNTIYWIVILNDPKKNDMGYSIRKIILWICPFISCFMSVAMITYALDSTFNLIKLVPLVIGIIFILVGNYLPKSKQNYAIGYRLPWTLRNKENWRKTNRLGGYLMVLSGIGMALFSFVPNLSFVFFFFIIIVNVIVPFLYSYFLHKQEGE